MNNGQIIDKGLNRAGLSIYDNDLRELANDYLMEIIEEHWNFKHWGFRKREKTITTVDGTEEYSLDKLARVLDIVPNTIRGSDPVRMLRYEPSHDFFKRRPYQLDEAYPYFLRDGVFQGFSNNPSAASVLACASSLANYTTGTMAVVNGLTRVAITTGAFTLDMLGRGFQVTGTAEKYRLVKYESSSVMYLDRPYEGASNATATFKIGDIFQKVSVLGYVSSQLQEEEVELNGTTAVSTTKSFTSLLRISKSHKTHGYVTCTSNAAAVTNIVLDPGETETEVQTVNLYPIPSDAETINYEVFIKHPILYRYTDSPLFPSEFHNLLAIDLYIRLEEEWNKVTVPQRVVDRRDKILNDLVTLDNNTDGWNTQQENFETPDRARVTNLPNTYGIDDDF